MTKNKKRKHGKESRSEELHRLIRAAALHLDPKASITTLATRAGINPETIRNSIRIGRFSAGCACAIESAVGRDVVTKEQLCPEKFATQ